MATVLGQVLASSDAPRGPDVKYSLRVPREWLRAGECLEFDLPRSLACARCDAGGCDACGGAGGISVRGREDPVEVVRVALSGSESAEALALGRQGFSVRVPEYGGPAREPEFPRGNLIVTLLPSDEPSPNVRRLEPLPNGDDSGSADAPVSDSAWATEAMGPAPMLAWVVLGVSSAGALGALWMLLRWLGG